MAGSPRRRPTRPLALCPARSGRAWARSRRSARALRAGVVAPVNVPEVIVGATPTGSTRRGPERSGYLVTRRFDSVTGSQVHDRDETIEAAGRSMPVIASEATGCGFDSRSGPDGPGSSTVEQLPVCMTMTAAFDHPFACGPEWSGYRLERPAWPGGRGFDSRLRSSEHTRRPAIHDRRLATQRGGSVCRT
jgi:hypothetical protein